MRSSFMIGCLVVLALFMSQFVPSIKAQQVAARTPKLFEYKVERLSTFLFSVADPLRENDERLIAIDLEKALNKVAVEGWEFSGGVQGYLIFKRQK